MTLLDTGNRFRVALMLLCVGCLTSVSGSPALEECDAQVRDAPRDHESYACFVDFVRAGEPFDEATRRLDALLQIDPARYHAALALGVIERFRNRPRAEALLLEAADSAEAAGDPQGVALARTGLGAFYVRRGRLGEADTQLALALAAAERAGDPMLVAGTLSQMALLAKARSDYGRARSLLREAESIVFPDGSTALKTTVLSGLGGVYRRLRQFPQAIDTYRREAELTRKVGDLRSEASARYNVALVSRNLTRRGLVPAEETERLTVEALEVALAARHQRVEARTRLLLGTMREGDAAIEQFEAALRLSAEIDHPQIRDWATREIARELIRQGPEHHQEGFRLMQQAIDRARATGDRDEVAGGLRARAFRAAVAGRPREEWIPWYLEALDAAEQLRDLQPEGGVRARSFTKWIPTYIALSGFLLDRLDSSPSPDDDLELAFHTMERMRGRMLLDTLDASGAMASTQGSSPLHEAREQLLEQLSEIQRTLMRTSMTEEQRRDALTELARLEGQEATTRDRLAREDPAFGRLRAPTAPSLHELRQALSEDQAILAFQLGDAVDARDYPRRGRFSWVVRVTREEVRAYALPEKSLLEQQVKVFQGLFERRDGSEVPAASGLYRSLLGQAIDGLPESVDKLILIPDGALHRLPFAALRSEPSAPPLIESYSIAYSPSATLWRRWQERQEQASAEPAPALVLADPEALTDEIVSEVRSALPWTEGMQLARLPHARREARALIRSMGSGEVRTGPEASESYLKQADLGSFGLVHFAAHAVLDDSHPDRSAVVLAPGNDDEDGLLQVREIVDLDLDGGVVVLSACRSASGTLLQGEGVMGLAHAFFQAGASTVVGSLWPLRDDDAALLLSRFADQLARGLTVSEAVAAAQARLIAEGRPAAAWAGLVVLGDGDRVPLPGGRSPFFRSSLWTRAWGLALVALGLGFLVVMYRSGRSRPKAGSR